MVAYSVTTYVNIVHENRIKGQISMNIIKRTIDNSYVSEKKGLPYHVPNEGEFAEEWAEINA